MATATARSAVLLLALIFFLLLPFLSAALSVDSPKGRRVLVLLDDLATKSSHSLYFRSFQSRSYDLDFKLADDPKIGLQRYGQYLYDGLILFCPATEREFLSLTSEVELNSARANLDVQLARRLMDWIFCLSLFFFILRVAIGGC